MAACSEELSTLCLPGYLCWVPDRLCWVVPAGFWNSQHLGAGWAVLREKDVKWKLSLQKCLLAGERGTQHSAPALIVGIQSLLPWQHLGLLALSENRGETTDRKPLPDIASPNNVSWLLQEDQVFGQRAPQAVPSSFRACLHSAEENQKIWIRDTILQRDSEGESPYFVLFPEEFGLCKLHKGQVKIYSAPGEDRRKYGTGTDLFLI